MKKWLPGMIALSLIIGLIWLADFHSVIVSLKTVRAPVVIFGCLLQVCTVLIINYQWYRIAGQITDKASFSELLQINLTGTFVESITPAMKIGGEAVKVWLIKSYFSITIGKALAIVGLQKLISLIPFLFLTLGSIIWFFVSFENYGNHIQLFGMAFLFLITLCGAIIFLAFYSHKLPNFGKSKLGKQIETGKLSLRSAFNSGIADKKELLINLFLALVIWLFFALKAYIIAYLFQLEIGFLYIALVTYLSYMAGMVPLTPGGLGTFEGAMVSLLTLTGIPSAEALAFTIVFRFITFWFPFLISGGYLLLTTNKVKIDYKSAAT